MALAEWLGKIGNNFSSNFDAAGPQGLAQLGAAIASAPRNQWGAGLAQGLAGFGETARANKKKAGLAEALKGAMGDFNPKQQSIMNALIGSDNVESALPMLMKNAFSDKSAKEWDDVDIDKDGRVDFQINPNTNERRASPLSYQDRLITALGAQNIPGIGMVDKFGNPMPQPGGSPQGAPMPQPQPQPRPAAPEAAPVNPPATVAEIGAGSVEALAPPPATVSAQANGLGAAPPAASGKMIIPIPTQQLGAFGLPQPGQGSRWVRDFDAKSRQWSQPRQESIDGAVDKSKEIPGELVARLGLATSFFKDADYVVKKIEEGATTGPGGQFNLALGRGDAAKVWRIASDGSDAMQRMLTGAGMPAVEATNYVARFLPTFGDSKATQLDKVQNLTRRLKAITELSARGRMTNEEIFRLTGVTEVGAGAASDAGGSKRIKYDANGNRVQ